MPYSLSRVLVLTHKVLLELEVLRYTATGVLHRVPGEKRLSRRSESGSGTAAVGSDNTTFQRHRIAER